MPKWLSIRKFIYCFFIFAFLSFNLLFLFKLICLPEFDEIKSKFKNTESVLYSHDGRVLSVFRMNSKMRRLDWITLSQIQAEFVKETLQQEDRRFYRHFGIDVFAFLSAFYENTFKNRHRGASTISMQLVKSLSHIHTKTFIGKISQIISALAIEMRWKKSEILEAYFNQISMRSDLVGLPATSVYLFQKSPLYLSKLERKILLTFIRNPKISWRHLEDKICQIKLCREEIQIIKKRYSEQSTVTDVTSANYLLHRFLLQNKKSQMDTIDIYSSVDYDLQQYSSELLRHQLSRLKSFNVNDGAILVLDNKSGHILSYVGSAGPGYSQSPYVDMIHAERQVGSVIKPFLYGLAFDNQIIDLNSWIDDSPLDIVFPNGTYTPSNHDHRFHGWVHPSTALGSSLNVPAVKIIQLVSVEKFWESLKKLKFNLKHEPHFYGPSLALGVLDASLWQLVQSYRELSSQNNSIYSIDTKNKLKWILSLSTHRALTFGQESVLNVPFGFAVKTGTSKDMKDNWCIGYNNRYTIGVWVGNSNSTSMHNILGVTGAAPIWRNIVEILIKKNSIAGFNDQQLLADHLQKKYFKMVEEAVPPKEFNKSQILSPSPQSIYAFDPNIPLSAQKLIFQASGSQNSLIWKINDQFIKDQKWSPIKGWNKVQLYRGSEKIDESLFLVK